MIKKIKKGIKAFFLRFKKISFKIGTREYEFKFYFRNELIENKNYFIKMFSVLSFGYSNKPISRSLRISLLTFELIVSMNIKELYKNKKIKIS